MNEQVTSEAVSLADLRHAIEAVPLHPGHCIPGQDVDRWLALLHEYRRWAVEAWRTAFDWLEGACQRRWEAGVTIRNSGDKTPWIAVNNEINEGMRLIREKLQS